MQIYDCPESELKLNEVFEFVGVLILDSDVMADKDDQDESSYGFIEDELVHLLPEKVVVPFEAAKCFLYIYFLDLFYQSPMHKYQLTEDSFFLPVIMS